MPTAEDVDRLLKTACEGLCDTEKAANTEIAFFGGSFTAISREITEPLLKIADRYIREYSLRGIRISTDPYFMTAEHTDFLSRYPLSAIELGVQSFDETVRLKNKRRENGFSDTERAILNIKNVLNCEIGIQMMTGMYGSTPESDLKTAEMIAALAPATLRVYPTVVLLGTELYELYNSGEFIPYGIETMVELCADIKLLMAAHEIRIIRMGLHSDIDLSNIAGGYFHPAFGELVESVIMRRKIEKLCLPGEDVIVVQCLPEEVSKVLGHKKMNVNYFASRGKRLDVRCKSGFLA
jgi:histone acetyltransferase (RNA polymerase elongator complex component)